MFRLAVASGRSSAVENRRSRGFLALWNIICIKTYFRHSLRMLCQRIFLIVLALSLGFVGNSWSQSFLGWTLFYEYGQEDDGYPFIATGELDSADSILVFAYDAGDGSLPWGQLVGPDGRTSPIPSDPAVPFLLRERAFVHPHQLRQAIAPGTYTLRLPTLTGGFFERHVALREEDLPPIPRLANYEDLLGFNANQPLTIRWDPLQIADGQEVLLQLGIESLESDNGVILGVGDFQPDRTELIIPRDTFDPGEEITGFFDLAVLLDGALGSEQTVLVDKQLKFRIHSASNEPDDTRPQVLRKSPDDFKTVSPNASVRVEFSEPMAESVAIQWGAPLEGAPSIHEWNRDRTVLHFRPQAGFAADTNYSYWINPPDHESAFTDLSGNAAASTTGFFSTSAATGGPDVGKIGVVLGERYRFDEFLKLPQPLEEPFIGLFASSGGVNAIVEVLVDSPSGADIPLKASEDGLGYGTEAQFADAQDGEAYLLPGDYQFNIITTRDGAFARRVHVKADGESPPVPILLNHPVAIGSGGGPVEWEPIANGKVSDWLQLRIFDHSHQLVYESPSLGQPSALNGLSTRVNVSSNKLRPGRVYHGELLVSRSDVTFQDGIESVSMRANVLRFELTTSGQSKRATLTATPVKGKPGSLAVEVRGETNVSLLFQTSEDLVNWETFSTILFDKANEVQTFEFESSSSREFLRLAEGGVR